MRKRVLCLCMVLAMCLSVLPVPVLADEAEGESVIAAQAAVLPNESAQDADAYLTAVGDSALVRVDTVKADPGETIQIPVVISSNPGIAGAMLHIVCDDPALTLTGITRGEVFADGTFNGNTNKRTVQWYNDESDVTSTGTMFTMEFEVGNDVTDGSRIPVAIELLDGVTANFSNYDSDIVSVTFETGYVTVGDPIVEYTVIWLDGDGSELDRKTYNQGQQEPITDKTPTKAEDSDFTYRFIDWDGGTLDGTTKTYRPTFESIRKGDETYTVVWLDGDGSELDRKTYSQGQQEPITDKTPTKAEDDEYTYRFIGWDDGMSDGTTKTYTPTFESIRKGDETYTVTYDGNGGEGTMESSTAHNGDSITLLPNGFNHPDASQVFKAWRIGDTEYNPGDIYTVSGNTTITAIWQNSGNNSQGCYVATAVYGSYDCPEVWTLRRFRDGVLAKTWYGRLFIHLYYKMSPTAVRLFGKTQFFQDFFRSILDPWVADLQANGFESTPYQDRTW